MPEPQSPREQYLNDLDDEAGVPRRFQVGARLDPEFTGDDLLRLVLDLQAAVGSNHAGMTPLGYTVMMLSEEAANKDETLKKFKE